MENETMKENTQAQSKHFGVVNLSIHYSLAAGLADQLGDQVERAVIAAVSKIGGNDNQFYFDGAVIRMDQFWHLRKRSVENTEPDGMKNSISIHLSNDLEAEATISVDWDWF
jgi:hypothetical protein